MSNTQENNKKILEALKTKANRLGITFHPNIGVDALKDKIDEKMSTLPKEDPVSDGFLQKKTQSELERKHNEAKKLVRVLITTMNPNKAAWDGEILSVGNSSFGFFKKYIVYGKPWHIPTIMLKTLEEKKYLQYYKVKDSHGRDIKKAREAREYTIDILDPLTASEIEDLAKVQVATGRLED